MAHVALVCPPISGHLDPLCAVGRALIGRGHRVSVLHLRDLEKKVIAQGLDFLPLDRPEFPAGTLQASVAKLAELKGSASLKFAIECARAVSRALLEGGPDVVRNAGVDVVVVDQNEPAGGSIAEHLALPFVSACTSLPLNREPLIPPPFMGWAFGTSAFASLRNRAGYAVADRMVSPIEREINLYRRRWSLAPLDGPDSSFSKLAQIAQMPREFDFPRTRLPSSFEYLGPWFDDYWSSRIPFPFDKLDGRPIIYGSIGTLQQEQSDVFRIMAEACSGINAQLVLSLGHPNADAEITLPGNPLVVKYAPQIEVLKRASATITHAGMNTTLQSLRFGVPTVAIPLAHDQPAIAARLARTGAGLVIKPKSLSAGRLRDALQRLLPNGSAFRAKANELGEASKKAGGAEAAATVVERVLGRL